MTRTRKRHRVSPRFLGVLPRPCTKDYLLLTDPTLLDHERLPVSLPSSTTTTLSGRPRLGPRVPTPRPPDTDVCASTFSSFPFSSFDSGKSLKPPSSVSQVVSWLTNPGRPLCPDHPGRPTQNGSRIFITPTISHDLSLHTVYQCDYTWSVTTTVHGLSPRLHMVCRYDCTRSVPTTAHGLSLRLHMFEVRDKSSTRS